MKKKQSLKNIISSLIYQPIIQPEFVSVQVIGVAQIINKKSGMHQFTEKDEEVSTLAQPLARYQPAEFQNGAKNVENVLQRFCFSWWFSSSKNFAPPAVFFRTSLIPC